MSGPFLKLIQAAPGWQCVYVTDENDEGRPEFEFEPIIGWAELEERPGELLPVCRDGQAERAVHPLGNDRHDYLGMLAPGEAFDPQKWSGATAWVLRRQTDAHRRDEQLVAKKRAEAMQVRPNDKITGLSYPAIGERFGVKDHSTEPDEGA